MSSTDMNHIELALPEEWLAESWNKQADEFNQWDSLSRDEQLGWAQVHAITLDRAARAALAANPPADDIIAHCPGDGYHEDGQWDWREGCEDCLRRTNPDPEAGEIKPPPIIAFWCELRIAPD